MATKEKNKRLLEDFLSVKKDSWTKQEVSFGSNDMVIESSHSDPLVINVRLNRYEVKWVLIDTRSSINLLTFDVHNK